MLTTKIDDIRYDANAVFLLKSRIKLLERRIIEHAEKVSKTNCRDRVVHEDFLTAEKHILGMFLEDDR